MTIHFLGEDGKRAGEEKWPLVSSNYGIPVPEEKKVPVKPGETRTWDLMTGSVPEGFDENSKVRLVATGVTFEEASPN